MHLGYKFLRKPAEIKVLSVENPELATVLLLKPGVDQNVIQCKVHNALRAHQVSSNEALWTQKLILLLIKTQS